MSFPRSFLRLVMQGTTYPGEIWTTSLSLARVAGGETPQPVDLDPFVAACSAWVSASGSRIPSLVKLTTVKVNRIGPDGKYVDPDQTFLVDLDTPVSGSSSGAVAPQLTMAVTLETAKQRGLGARGRIFPPLCAPSVGSDGLVAETTCTEIANSATTLIAALNTIVPEVRVVVASGVREGALVPVTRVTVGRTIDTQRRRRNAMPDTRVLASTALPS